MGLEGEGSVGRGGGKWGERGREVGIRTTPLSTPSVEAFKNCKNVWNVDQNEK